MINQTFLQSSTQYCGIDNSEWWPYQIHEVTQFPICESDGVVTRISANTLPNPGGVYYIEIENANHQQLVNHPNMTTELNAILINGDYDEFFKVE